MTMTQKLLRIASVLALLGLAGTAFSAGEPFAAAQGTDLFGGPAARGAGLAGARFDTRIYVSSIDPATGTVDFIYNGSIVTSVPFSLAGRSAAVLPTPQALEGIGAFLFRVHSDTPVTAWSETYNDTSSGQFGLSIQAVASSDFLNPGDEASGGGADVSSSMDAGRARTNVGIVCSPTASESCTLEVAAFDRGTLVGTGTISTSHGSVGQNSLASLVPGTAEKAGLALRLRVITGSGRPYAIKNNNRTSDGSEIPLSVMRNVFSTGPTISSFLVTPNSGCPSSTFTASWTTDGASRVTISGVGGDLPPSGSTTFTLLTSTDVVLTAYAATGGFSTQTRHITILPPAAPPTPSPSAVNTTPGAVTTGIIPSGIGTVTFAFTQQGSGNSTFTLQGTAFTYVAGSTEGTDVITLTANGGCGNATATFTANVLAPGAVTIDTFTADPNPGCAPAETILTWATTNGAYVLISGIQGSFPPNGATGIVLDTTTSITLTAVGVNGSRAKKTITVVVDTTTYTPIVTPSIVTVQSGATVDITITNVPDLGNITYQYASRDSGGFIVPAGPGVYHYMAGQGTGMDVVRFYYLTGCGRTYATFSSTVTPQGP